MDNPNQSSSSKPGTTGGAAWKGSFGRSAANDSNTASNGSQQQFISAPAAASSSTIPSAPDLSLPNGGGAIRGIGEKFNVNLCTGAASASIPIHASPSRGSLNPNLSLSYSSSAGNGPFGLGWGLSLPNVTRKTEKGLPLYVDGGEVESDVFLISNQEDLVPLFRRDAQNNRVLGSDGKPAIEEAVQTGYVVRRYSPRVEGQFTRIERWTSLTDANDVYWRSTSPDNVTSIFGADASSRILDPASGVNESPRIFTWLISEMYDSKGNAMLFGYKPEDSSNVPNDPNELNRTAASRSANRYIKSIRYCNTSPNRQADTWAPISASTLPASTWKLSIVFDYGEHDLASPGPDDAGLWSCRADPFSVYRSRFEVRTYRLCRRVLMFHSFAELQKPNYLVSSTDLTYDNDPSATHLLSAVQAGYTLNNSSGVSSLSTYTRRALPPTEFFYSSFPTDQELSQVLFEELDAESMMNLPVGLDGANYQWVDLDGEGLSGLLTDQGGSWYYKRNTSANNLVHRPAAAESGTVSPGSDAGHLVARLGAIEELRQRPSVSVAPGGQAHFGDVNGNGKLDVIQTNGSASWGYYERTEEGGWMSLQTFQIFPNLSTSDPNVKIVDLTGDGLADILIYADQIFYWHMSLGAWGYDRAQAVTQPNNEEEGPQCVYADTEQTIYLADMSGDGLSDLVRVRNCDVVYWPNRGYGTFGTLVRMANAPVFESFNFNKNRMRLADVDGSGNADLLYFGPDGVDLYRNLAGNGFSHKKQLMWFPPTDDLSSLNVVDLLGNGTQCIVWSSGLPSDARATLKYIDIMQGKKPHLLRKMVNNLGTERHISYAPSTRFYLDDKENGTPWVTRLPFPVQCVERVEVLDRISGGRFVNRYRYSHGFYDGFEREFRGFARVDQWDTDDFPMNSTPTIGPGTQSAGSSESAMWHVPPVRTKTWFHTGAYVDSQSIRAELAKEYFTAGDSSSSHSFELEDTALPLSLSACQEVEAARSMKGQVLRTEVYADDGSPMAHIPYSVAETNYTIVAVQPLQDIHQHGVYLVHKRESITAQLERNPADPRLTHELVLQVDAFGHVLKSLKAAYGRARGTSQLTGVALAAQEATSVAYIEFDFTNGVDTATDYLLPMPSENRTYEITGLAPRASDGRYHVEDFEANSFALVKSMPAISFEVTPAGGTSPQKRIIGQSRVIYRSDDLSRLLPLGQLQSLALPGQTLELVFTSGLVTKVFQGPSGPLMADPKSVLLGTVAQQAGYVDADGDGNFWRPGPTMRFAPNPATSAVQELALARGSFFSPQSFIDPFGNVSVAAYDTYFLFTVSVKDPVGNTKSSTMDYRVLRPASITEINGNVTAAAYDAMGLVAGTAVMGKQSENLGDSLTGLQADLTDSAVAAFFATPTPTAAAALLGSATTRVVYDMNQYWIGRGAPIWTCAITRQSHVNDPMLRGTPPAVDIIFTYSDGFGRVVQTKKLTKPGPLVDGGPVVQSRWVGSGWTVYNNKGKPVKQFENFFADTNVFKNDAQVGVTPILLYDPLSRVVAKLRPDKAVEKTIFDVWSQSAYDANDNVLLSDPKTDPDVGQYFTSLPQAWYSPSWYDARIGGALGADKRAAATKAATHANTPQVTYLDAMGRTVMVVADNGGGNLFPTAMTFDILGRPLTIIDAMTRTIRVWDYNVCGDKIHRKSLDTGDDWMVNDAMSHELLRWTDRKYRFRSVYDSARRPVQLLLNDLTSGSTSEVLIEQSVYGEASPDADTNNLRGKIWQVKDQCGILVNAYDVKGNTASRTRTFATDYKNLLDLNQTVAMNGESFTSTMTFDAGNRPVLLTASDASVTFHAYSRLGVLNQVFINVRGENTSPNPTTWTPIISNLDYDPKGLLKTISNGNGTVTTRTYNPNLFRLTNQYTAGPSSRVLQNLNYTYDPVGNVSYIRDNAQQTIYFRNAQVSPSTDYTYDPTYRLVSATGREHLGQNSGAPGSSSAPGPDNSSNTSNVSPGDGNAMRTYTELYTYDAVGNILSVKHAGSSAQSLGWTRRYTYAEPSSIEPAKLSNKLTSTTVESATESYTYDTHGNITSIGNLQMQWDFKNKLCSSTKQRVSSGTPETTYYVYKSTGERLRKATERQASAGSTTAPDPPPTRSSELIYVDSLDIYCKYRADGTTVALERVTFHVYSDTSLVANIETRTVGTDPGAVRVFCYQLSNHLGSVAIETDDQGRLLSYEEYYPFGSTSYQGVDSTVTAPKRYRYSGKERDEESGLYYFGARYYASWLGRWTAVDPLGDSAGGGKMDAYVFSHNNPVRFNDPDGRDPTDSSNGMWVKVDNTGDSGTVVHQAVLPQLAFRSLTELGIPAFWNGQTDPGGSFNPKSMEPGWVDFGQLLPSPTHPGAWTGMITDLKPYTTDKVTEQGYFAQVYNYLDYGLKNKYNALGLPDERNGLPVPTLHANPMYVPSSFLAPVYFQRDGREFKAELSIVRKELVTGETVGIIEYQLYVKMKPEEQPHTVPVPAVDKQRMEDMIAKMRTVPYATAGSQASWGGRNAGATVGAVITVTATVAFVGGVLVVTFAPAAPALPAAGPTVFQMVAAGLRALTQGLGPMIPAGAAGAALLGQKQDKGKQ